MKGRARTTTPGGLSAAMLLGGAVCALAVPSAVLAFTSGLASEAPDLATHDNLGSFTAASVDARLAREVSMRALAKGHVFRFTPAGTTTRPDRSVTVAVRVDQDTARTIVVRGDRITPTAMLGTTALRIAPTAYSLGVARGYQGFAQGTTPPASSGALRDIDMPDLAAFKPATPAAGNSRFNPRIALDEGQSPGSAPRTFSGDGEQSVDVGGSYRLTRNINVTAGVRYSEERERLVPLTDGKQDNQAVYLGTQFRF